MNIFNIMVNYEKQGANIISEKPYSEPVKFGTALNTKVLPVDLVLLCSFRPVRPLYQCFVLWQIIICTLYCWNILFCPADQCTRVFGSTVWLDKPMECIL